MLSSEHSDWKDSACLHLGSDIISQRPDPLFDVVAQTVNLSSNKIQPVPLILPLLQAEDPAKGQRSQVKLSALTNLIWKCFIF